MDQAKPVLDLTPILACICSQGRSPSLPALKHLALIYSEYNLLWFSVCVCGGDVFGLGRGSILFVVLSQDCLESEK